MHFIEDWFGRWPDGGNGWLEIMTLVLLVGVAATIGRFLPIGERSREK